jgi:hypothetical protein
MERDVLERWISSYGESWKRQNLIGFMELFADGATYMFTPLNDLMRGKEEIRRYVESGYALQKDIEFDHELLALNPTGGICRWKAALTWKATEERVRFDGIYSVYLNEQRLCYRFDEWWHCTAPVPVEQAPQR